MNNHNPADPSARALFYGAFNIGRATLDGNAYNGVSSGIVDNSIKWQMLKDSPYGLAVRKDFLNTNSEIKATAYLEAREAITNSDVTVYLMVESFLLTVKRYSGDLCQC